jgi:GT2 family glycosyltransferase
VLVNDDCVCDAGFVAELVRALDPAGGVVMAAGVLLEPGGETIDTAGMEVDRSLLVFDHLNGQPVSVLDDGPTDPIGPCGAAAAFDRNAFLELGGFDERLFAYWEDVDLVLRLREAGGRCRLATRARGVHEHSATLGSGSAAKNYLTGFGRGYVLRKWRGGSLGVVVRAAWRDLPIVLGQALVDRTLAGARGRRDGWRAAVSVADPVPRVQVAQLAVRSAPLRRRLARRARLRARRVT